MGDWSIVPDVKSEQNKKATQAKSDWSIVEPEPSSRQPQPNESLGEAAIKAPFRLYEDAKDRVYNTIKNIPQNYESTKKGITGAFAVTNPNRVNELNQLGAGLAEQGNSLYNIPHDISNYATNRLNLIPKEFNEKVQNHRMPDMTEAINKRFGKPQDAGEEALRWTAKNSLNLLGVGKAANVLNPRNLTNAGIARNVVAEEGRQIAHHTNMYNNLWRSADRAGIRNVPVDQNLVGTNLNFIRQYKSPKDYRTLEYFNQHPTLPNAQAAVSDLRKITRALDEKSKTSSLTGEERSLYDAASHTERHIESNMFRNANGSVNQRLANRYRHISNSYRENVVPYRYDKDIQEFKDRNITAKQLVQRLSTGAFAAKKLGSHPAIRIRNSIVPVAKGTGIIGGGKYLYDQAFGAEEQK